MLKLNFKCFRYDYTEAKVNWADVVVPVGGDGTFLLAASKVKNNQKPVIGFNSDPTRSEGHLCVPKKYSTDIVRAIQRVQKVGFYFIFCKYSQFSTATLTEDEGFWKNIDN